MTFEKVYGRAWRSLLGYVKVAEMFGVSARTCSNDNIVCNIVRNCRPPPNATAATNSRPRPGLYGCAGGTVPTLTDAVVRLVAGTTASQFSLRPGMPRESLR